MDEQEQTKKQKGVNVFDIAKLMKLFKNVNEVNKRNDKR